MTARFRLPAEWEPQAAVVVAWPHADTDWAPRLPRIETAYVALIGAIARFEPVLICVADAAVRERATQLLARCRRRAVACDFVEVDYDDTWLRDSGPLTLEHGTRSASSISASPAGAANSKVAATTA